MPGYSPFIPLQLDAEDGYKLTQTLKDMIAQNVKMIVLTNPGERVMIPDFGVGLRNYLFDNFSEEVFANIRGKIHQQIERWMPFVQIEEINFFEVDLHAIAMELQYYVPTINLSEVLDFSVTSNGEAA